MNRSNDNILNKSTIRKKRENQINTFLQVFFNYRYEEHNLFFGNLDTFFYLICRFIDETREFMNKYPYQSLDWFKVEEMSFSSKEKLIDAFFKRINIPFCLNDIIKNGILNVTFEDKNDAISKNSDSLVSGRSTVCSDKVHESVEVYDNGLVTDASVWVHEILHHLNLDIQNRNLVRSLFTESLAFAYEFIFLNFLDEKEFSYEAEKLKYNNFKTLFYTLCNTYPIIKLYIIFDKFGKVTKENYKMYFEYDNDYDDCLESLSKRLNNKDYDHIYLLLKYSLAFALSIYMYIEYTKDASFINKMNSFNGAIKTKSVMECLNVIGITEISEQELKKIITNVRLMKLELLNGFDRSVSRACLVDSYLKAFTTLFSEKTMLYQNLDKLLKLINFLRYHISEYIGFVIPDVEIDKLSKASKEEKYDLIEHFYKYIGRKNDLADKRNKTTVKKENVEEILKTKDPSFLVRTSLRGTSYFDEDICEKAAIVYDTGYVLDSVAWVHEFRHLDNQPNKVRCEVSFLLTESVSFFEELIYGDFLEKIGYSYEAAFCKYDFLANLDVFIEDTYPVAKMLKIFVKTGRISKLNYHKEFENDDDYEDILSEALTILCDDPEDILSGIKYTVSSAIAIYMYIEYTKDKDFINRINTFSASINDKDLLSCLNIIGLTGLNRESLEKIKLSIDEFKKELDEISRKNIICLYDMEKKLSI